MSKISIGKLYIFEGIDNVGKTSIIKEVSKVLKNKNIPYSTYSFPGKEPNTLGALIYDFHHNKDKYIAHDINNASLQLLHVASHIDLLTRCIIPDLKQGKTVLLDRSWWSTYVYGIANGISKKHIKMILAPEIHISKEIVVGKIFLIKREQKTYDYDEITTKNILNEYDSLAAEYQSKGLVNIIHNNGNILDVVSEIGKLISGQFIEKSNIQLSFFSEEFSTCKFNLSEKKIYSSNVPIPSSIYDTYWQFAAKRQDIFFLRLKNHAYPWTDDPILLKHKFTNAYRASDRVSQYLIKNIIYKKVNLSPEDMTFRIILFKLFNKIETWEALENYFGEITYRDYNFEKYDGVLSDLLSKGIRIYSAAYIMPSGKSAFLYSKKHQNNLALIEIMMKDGISKKIAKAQSMKELYNLMLQYPTLGEFLAFQLSIDINYSELCDFSEMSFVVAGPGAQSGIKKCFNSLGNYTYEDIILYMAERQQEEFERLGLHFQSLWGRPLQLIDCQNLFCETDKYARVAHPNVNGDSGRTRIKQLYKPSNRETIEYFYPPKWNINQHITVR